MRTSRRFFTLLEIMVGLSLVLMAAGAIGWKMHGLIEARRFKADLEQLKSRIQTIRTMAINMQSDWEGILKRDKKHWTFEAICLDPPRSKSFSPTQLRISEVVFNEKSRDHYTFFFSSTGEVLPSGSLFFRPLSKSGKTERLDFPEIFGKREGFGGKELGPAHPNEGAS